MSLPAFILIFVYLLQVFGWVYALPPRIIVLEPFVKPCHHGVYPFGSLYGVHDTMILAFHFDESRWNAQQFECCKHLYRLTHGHVSVGGAMSEEYGFFYLVCILTSRKRLRKLPRGMYFAAFCKKFFDLPIDFIFCIYYTMNVGRLNH